VLSLVLILKFTEQNNCSVFIPGGRTNTGIHPLEWAKAAEKLGAVELLSTCTNNDGMKSGPNLEISRQIAEAVNIPIVNSGGCGLAKHFSEGFLKGIADAISAGTFFTRRDQNFMQTRLQIMNAGATIQYHR